MGKEEIELYESTSACRTEGKLGMTSKNKRMMHDKGSAS